MSDPSVRNVLGMGASLGYAFRATGRLRVMPEVALLMPVAERVQGRWARMDVEPNLQPGLLRSEESPAAPGAAR